MMLDLFYRVMRAEIDRNKPKDVMSELRELCELDRQTADDNLDPIERPLPEC